MIRKKGPRVPTGIGAKLRGMIREKGYSIYGAAAAADIPNSALYEAVNETLPMSPATAARLHRIGIDGRALFIEQASLKLQQYEAEEAVFTDATERLCGGIKVAAE